MATANQQETKLKKVSTVEPAAFLRPDVCALTSLSPTTLFKMIRAGDFPAPAKLGKRSIWSAREVHSWLDARFAAREVQK